MILWITGNTHAGKTTLAEKLTGRNTIVLDGDMLRGVWEDLGLSEEDRKENCLRAARLAILLELQGFAVIVSVICPYENLRRIIKTMTGCNFIYIPGGLEGPEYPYEIPHNPAMIVDTSSWIRKD